MFKIKPRPVTPTEKRLYAAALGALIIAWFAGAIEWYACLLPALYLGSFWLPQKSAESLETAEQAATSTKKAPAGVFALSSILVSIDGHDSETTQRMGTLCESMGLSPVLGPAPTAVLAIVGPNTAFQFSTFGVPTVSLAEAPRMLELVVAKVAANPDTATLKNLRQAVDFGKEQFDPDHSAFLSLPALPEDPQHHRTELEHARIEDITHSPHPRNTKPAPTPKTARPGRVSLPHTFTFVYRGQDGNYSRRTVDVSHVATNGGHTYLEGFCHERGDTRTFRTDRMRGDLTDMETGELVPIKRLVAHVHTHARMDYRPTGPTLKPRPKKQWQTAVLFTGFSTRRRGELEALADSAGWSVRVSVGSTLDYLVTGTNGGLSKVAKAEALGVTVIDEDTFLALASSGATRES